MIVTERMELQTAGGGEIIDLTSLVAETLQAKGLKEGSAVVFVSHSTAAVTTIEFEGGLLSDLKKLFEGLIPAGDVYEHNRRWDDDNGHAHLRASLIGPSVVVPFSGGALMLGMWQQIVMLDFDNGPRRRTVIIQLSGE